MTPENFCYWLQGFFEINRKNTTTPFINITPSQSLEIENHLKLVFHKVTPTKLMADGVDIGLSKVPCSHSGHNDFKPFIEVQYLNAVSC